MKYIYDEVAGDGRPRLVFALGHQEAIIIFGLLAKAKLYMPKTFETQFDSARINDMYTSLYPLMQKLMRLDYTENKPRKRKPGQEL